jgi:hypothetical protein
VFGDVLPLQTVYVVSFFYSSGIYESIFVNVFNFWWIAPPMAFTLHLPASLIGFGHFKSANQWSGGS